jgi:hypothetical protein
LFSVFQQAFDRGDYLIASIFILRQAGNSTLRQLPSTQQQIIAWIVGTKSTGAFQQGRNAIAEGKQRQQRERDKQKTGEPPHGVFAACELAIEQQHNCRSKHNQCKNDECPSVEMKAEQCAAIRSGTGKNMDEDLPASDSGASKGANDRDTVVTCPRPEPQIERKTESCHDKARTLQNAQRARQVIQ